MEQWGGSVWPCGSPLPVYSSACGPLCTTAGSPCRTRVKWPPLADLLKFKGEEGVVIQSLNKHSISILGFRPKQVQQCANYSECTLEGDSGDRGGHWGK